MTFDVPVPGTGKKFPSFEKGRSIIAGVYDFTGNMYGRQSLESKFNDSTPFI
jgi:hypothetical protein